MSDLFTYVLGLADDALISTQRLGWWIGRAPELEEDVALANIALDQLGQARFLLSYAGEVEGQGRDEDALAYWRDDREFRNVHLVERPQTDFGVTIVRLLVLATYQAELYARLVESTDLTLVGVAAKAVKEVAYHCDHAEQWVVRLGLGTSESRARVGAALVDEWPYVEELFAPFGVDVAGAIDHSTLREPVLARLNTALERADLAVPDVVAARGGGRQGLHTEHLGPLLAEMQHLARSHPGASW